MNETEHQNVFESLGAYALGALPDAERERAAAHIAACPICAEDAAALERAAGRLIDIVPVVAPPPELRDRIMTVVNAEAALLRATARPPEEPRRRVRRASSWGAVVSLRWATAASALLIAGGVVGSQVFGGSGGGDTRTLSAEVGRGHAWVEVSGDRARLVVNGMPHPGNGRVYELWVQRGEEPPQPASADLDAATFVVGSGRVDIPARLEHGDRVLVTSEPAGGSRAPTTAPVVVTSRV